MHLLPVCLTWALLCTAESLRCLECSDQLCTSTVSVDCPAGSNACQTITSVMLVDSVATVTVNKTCSTLLTCVTPVNVKTEWSVNRGYSREAHNQLCCLGNNCNLATLATPGLVANGKECPSCQSAAAAQAGTCNVNVTCVGAEDSCFSTTSEPVCNTAVQLGCLSRNLCTDQLLQKSVFATDILLTCGAAGSCELSLGAALLAVLGTAWKALV